MAKRKNKRWIQKAKIKKGALHRQLSVPADKDIPITLLKRIKITTLLKRRVNFALNVR